MLIVKKFGGSSVANKEEYSMWQNAVLRTTEPDMT